MKNNDIKKQSNLFVMLSSLLCVFMIASVFTSNFRFKPTYSASDVCESDECLVITCPYGPEPCEGTQCYECPWEGGITVPIYDVSAEAAKEHMRAIGDCHLAASNSSCDQACTEVCHKCIVNGQPQYVYAIGTQNARSKLGVGSDVECSQVSSTECDNPPVPVTKNCYGCDVSGTTKYVTTTTASKAEQLTGGTNCNVVSDSFCTTSPSVNPPTGTAAIVIAWIVGVLAIGYAVWYFIKLNAIK